MDDLERFIKEDLGKEGDVTTDSLFENEIVEAKIIAKGDCILAGLDAAEEVFNRFGAKLIKKLSDGNQVKKGENVAVIKGPARSVLSAERLALNIIGRMSGIATETRKLVDICRSINPNVDIAATRKTTPGFRKYEKKAVHIGGGEPHRFGLYDEVMIKDNHIRIVGSVEKAIKTIKEKVKDKIIEVEVENEKDAVAAAALNVDVIMLDNFDSKNAEVATKKIKEINPELKVEISGGIDKNNISKYAAFADRISLGYLTHSVKNIDFSMEIIN